MLTTLIEVGKISEKNSWIHKMSLLLYSCVCISKLTCLCIHALCPVTATAVHSMLLPFQCYNPSRGQRQPWHLQTHPDSTRQQWPAHSGMSNFHHNNFLFSLFFVIHTADSHALPLIVSSLLQRIRLTKKSWLWTCFRSSSVEISSCLNPLYLTEICVKSHLMVNSNLAGANWCCLLEKLKQTGPGPVDKAGQRAGGAGGRSEEDAIKAISLSLTYLYCTVHCIAVLTENTF